jgi:hypothetical protein
VSLHQSTRALAVSAIVVGASGAASAQQPASTAFGARHQVVISAEHLAGVTRTTSNHVSDRKIDMWLFGSNRQNPGLGASSPYAAPRAAVDFFVADRWSIGTSLLLSKLGWPDSHQIVFGPRIGAVLPLSPRWNLWGRVGFTYVRQSDDFVTASMETTLYAITLEAPFVATLGGNFFLSAVPTANLGVGGSSSVRLQGPGGVPNGPPDEPRTEKQTELGLQAALGGFF